MKKGFNQLCVLEGTVVGNSKKVQEDFVKFFKDEMGVEVKYETEVKTLPDNPECTESGGRNDLFFYIADKDISKFAVRSLYSYHEYTKEFSVLQIISQLFFIHL